MADDIYADLPEADVYSDLPEADVGALPGQSISAVKDPNWGWLDPVRQGLAYLGLPEAQSSNIRMNLDANGELEQEQGLRTLGASLFEMLGAGGGGLAGGTAGGLATGGNPISIFTGGTAGAEFGYIGANELNKALGLRPDTEANSLKTKVEQAPLNMAVDAFLPYAGKAALKGARGVTSSIIDRGLDASKQAVRFLDKDNQLIRALTDDPNAAMKTEILSAVEKVPELFAQTTEQGLGNKGARSSFVTMLDRINGADKQLGLRDQVGREVDQVAKEVDLSKAAPTKLKDVVDWDEIRRNDRIAVGAEHGAADSVADKELDNFARVALPADDYRKYQSAKKVFKTLKEKDDRGDILSQEELNKYASSNLTILNAEREVGEYEFSAEDLRKWKTRFYDNARFDRASIPDNIEAQRSETYKAFGRAFDNAFKSKVQTYSDQWVQQTAQAAQGALNGPQMLKQPNPYQRLLSANERYSAIQELTPFIERRASEARIKGPFFRTGAWDAKEGIVNRIQGAFLPESGSPEWRLRVSTDRAPRGGLRTGAAIGDAVSTALDRGISQPLYMLDQATAYGKPLMNYSGAAATAVPSLFEAIGSVPEAAGEVMSALNSVAGMGSNAMNAIGSTYPQPVQLPELNPENPFFVSENRIPKATLRMSTAEVKNNLGTLSQVLPRVMPPEDAQNVLAAIQKAIDTKDSDALGRTVASLVKVYPEARSLFNDPYPEQPFMVVDGKVHLPEDRIAAEKWIKKGEGTSIEKAKRMSALNKDGSILPASESIVPAR